MQMNVSFRKFPKGQSDPLGDEIQTGPKEKEHNMSLAAEFFSRMNCMVNAALQLELFAWLFTRAG